VKRMILAALAGLLLTSCAVQEATTGEPVAEKQYRTGSNIPVKHPNGDGVTTISKEEMDRSRDSSLTSPQMPMPRPGGR
jgi:hypothetical protein